MRVFFSFLLTLSAVLFSFTAFIIYCFNPELRELFAIHVFDSNFIVEVLSISVLGSFFGIIFFLVAYCAVWLLMLPFHVLGLICKLIVSQKKSVLK
ncbi:MAG: hypothetical protein R3Y43_01950 [Alphaproteobacteria bacterium]